MNHFEVRGGELASVEAVARQDFGQQRGQTLGLKIGQFLAGLIHPRSSLHLLARRASEGFDKIPHLRVGLTGLHVVAKEQFLIP